MYARARRTDPSSRKSNRNPSGSGHSNAPAMDYKKLAGLGSQSKFSFLEDCHD
jgi:hypothetical protein